MLDVYGMCVWTAGYIAVGQLVDALFVCFTILIDLLRQKLEYNLKIGQDSVHLHLFHFIILHSLKKE
jgi:hypothetical protein